MDFLNGFSILDFGWSIVIFAIAYFTMLISPDYKPSKWHKVRMILGSIIIAGIGGVMFNYAYENLNGFMWFVSNAVICVILFVVWVGIEDWIEPAARKKEEAMKLQAKHEGVVDTDYEEV